tara:strand:+ start:1072 stop:2079 length:1008 start_codon:yes stop_codon:yes gene_type:complete
MSTNPNDGSISSVTEMLMETTQQDNSSEAVDASEEVTEGAQTETEEVTAESEDATSYDSDDEAVEPDYENVDEDEYTDEPAAPVELSDDLELEVKSDGQLKKVTLQELKRGYAGQDYVQKGMEQNANQRKEIEQLNQTMQQERAQFLQRLDQIENGNFSQLPQKPSKELQNSDPLGYLEQMEEYREKSVEFEKLRNEGNQVREQQTAQEAQSQQAYISQQAEILKQEIPELRDPEKSKKLLSDIHATATGYYGVPEEIVGALSHGWEFKIMRDAVAYQKLQGTRQKVAEKSKTARPMVRPGAKRTEDGQAKKRQQVRSRMKKSGDIKSVTSFLLS